MLFMEMYSIDFLLFLNDPTILNEWEEDEEDTEEDQEEEEE